MKYLILNLSTLLMFAFACATVEKEVVVDVVEQSVSDEVVKPHIMLEDIMTDNWVSVGQEPYPNSGYVDIYLINKDFNADVQYAMIRFIPSYRQVMGYAYMIEGKIYIFQLTDSGDYEPAELRDIDIEFWAEKFRYYFLSNDMKDCSIIEQIGG